MTLPLPTSAALLAEVPIRSGGCASAPPSATVSPVGAAGRAEVTAEVGGTGSTPPNPQGGRILNTTSAEVWAEVEREMTADPERGYLLGLDYWIGRSELAESDADRLYRFVLLGGPADGRQAVLRAHLEAREARK